MNLVPLGKGLGLTPRVIGNVKGLQDPYRNPTTQTGFAEKWGQNPAMVTSFADGTKISFEQAIVANATGFKVRARGMSRGIEYERLDHGDRSALRHRRAARLGGIVDYMVGPADQDVRASPSTRTRSSALSEPVQDGRRTAVPVLHPVPPRALRGAELDRPRRRFGDNVVQEGDASDRVRVSKWGRWYGIQNGYSGPSPSLVELRYWRCFGSECSARQNTLTWEGPTV